VKILVTGPPNSGKHTIVETLDYECIIADRQDVEKMILKHDGFDAAIIVVDANHLCEGIFSFMALVEILGVSPIVAVLNKMDLIDNCNTQYVAMCQVLGDCVPMGREEITWYNGCTLIEYIEREVA